MNYDNWKTTNPADAELGEPMHDDCDCCCRLTSTQIEDCWDELRAEAERGRIRAIEFHIEKLKHGLAMPPDPEALAHYERVMRELRKRAAS